MQRVTLDGDDAPDRLRGAGAVEGRQVLAGRATVGVRAERGGAARERVGGDASAVGPARDRAPDERHQRRERNCPAPHGSIPLAPAFGTVAGMGSLVVVLADYADHEQAIGLDWYAADPNLRQLLDRLLARSAATAPSPRTTSPATARCAAVRSAARAEITDKHGPVLRALRPVGRARSDRIEHHPAWLESKADLVRAGFTGLPAHAGRPVPAVRHRRRSRTSCARPRPPSTAGSA